jgi:hypothetical protein
MLIITQYNRLSGVIDRTADVLEYGRIIDGVACSRYLCWGEIASRDKRYGKRNGIHSLSHVKTSDRNGIIFS